MTDKVKTIDLHAIVSSGKALTRYVTETVSMIQRLKVRMHNTACMTIYWAAENGEASQLNRFYAGLSVNEQTALRRWVAEHFTYQDEVNGEKLAKNWLKFKATKGDDGEVVAFYCPKGLEDKRKGVYSLDELLALKPFFEKDVAKSEPIDLVKLVEMLKSAGKRVEKQSDDNGITLTEDVTAVLAAIGKIKAPEAANDTTSRSNVA